MDQMHVGGRGVSTHQPRNKKARKGFFTWLRKVWDISLWVLKPLIVFCELAKQKTEKVYCSCKVRSDVITSQGLEYFVVKM